MAAPADISDEALFSLIVNSPPIHDLLLADRRTGRSSQRAQSQGGANWLAAALGNTSFEQSMERSRLHAEDMPQHTPQLQRVFAQLDLGVARFALEHPYKGNIRRPEAAALRAAGIRIGSIAADLPQQAFYWRVAASPAVRHICEVGFNAGHSTALWLSANPTATVETFDLFSKQVTGFMTPNLHLLQRLFPGRITAHVGDSTKTIPAADLVAPCDLVHVDGRHSYANVLADTMNLMRKARRTALYLFDDQCDARNCSGPNVGVKAQPGLATCDMALGGLLEPVAAVLDDNPRQFALFRQNRSWAREILRDHSNVLPCSFCALRLACDERKPRHQRGSSCLEPAAHKVLQEGLRAEQQRVRSKACQVPAWDSSNPS